MRMDKLTNQLQLALADAQSMALGKDNNFIEPVHLLAALLQQEGGSTRPLLQKAGANVAGLTAAAGKAVEALPTVSGSGGDVHMSNDLGRILNVSDKLAQKGGDAYISSELVLLAMLESKSSAGEMLKEHGVTAIALQAAIEQVRGGETVNNPEAEESRQALDKYTVDLTERAEQGKLDPVIGRDDEIRRTRRRQDRDHRGPGPAGDQRRSAGRPEGQAHPVPGPGGPAGRCQVPRRLRGAAEGGAQRAFQAGGPRHPVH